jgi:glycosyltransferase involved in cell wall biosynthesis
MMKLSVVMPVYNESATLENVLERVLGVDYGCELEVVIVDDGSEDGSGELAESLASREAGVLCLRHPMNGRRSAPASPVPAVTS